MSKRHAIPSLFLLAGACVTGNPPGLSLDEGTSGGTLFLDACGYTVTTRAGASAPRIIQAGAEPLGPDPTPRQLHLGLAADPAHSVVFLWRTNDDTTPATSVRYGLASATENRVDGYSFLYGTGLGENGPPARMHEVHLCGLSPDTVYHFQVGGVGAGGAEAWSPEHTFRTGPDLTADPSAQVTLLVLGDSRGAYSDWADLIHEARSVAPPDMILFTGDAVTFGGLQSDWDSFYTVAQDVLAEVPTVMVHGNHDENALAYFSQNANPGDQQVFSIDYGAAHITVLNDTPLDPTSITQSQAQFLDSDLALHASAGWKILAHHQPMFSSAAAHGSNLMLRGVWEPIVDQHGVDLVVNGHDHDYERTVPLKNAAQVAAGAGAVYVVSGGAGATPYDNGHDYFTAYSEKAAHFIVLDVRRGSMQARVYRKDGSLMDSFGFTK